MPKTVRNEPLYSIGLNQKGGQIIFNKNLPGFRMLISKKPPSMHALNNKPMPFIIPVEQYVLWDCIPQNNIIGNPDSFI